MARDRLGCINIKVHVWATAAFALCSLAMIYRVAQKSNPQLNDQKNRMPIKSY